MHAIAVYNKIHKGTTSGKQLINSLHDQVWLGDTLHAAFQHEDFEFGPSLPRDEDIKLDTPPCKAKRTGRAKGRIPNQGLSERKNHASSSKRSLPGSSMNEDDTGDTQGQGQPRPKRPRRCGTCGHTGHNVRTCTRETTTNEVQQDNDRHEAQHVPSIGMDECRTYNGDDC